MIQHILYINSIQRCLNHGTHFTHKQAAECTFGQLFYSEIKPNFDYFCAEKKQLVERVEKTHTAFHEAASHIIPENPDIEQARQDAWFYSTQLVNMLNRLEKM